MLTDTIIGNSSQVHISDLFAAYVTSICQKVTLKKLEHITSVFTVRHPNPGGKNPYHQGAAPGVASPARGLPGELPVFQASFGFLSIGFHRFLGGSVCFPPPHLATGVKKNLSCISRTLSFFGGVQKKIRSLRNVRF